MRVLGWFESGAGASGAEISALEAHIGEQFPDDFRAFFAEHAGSSNPDIGTFTVPSPQGAFEGYFGCLLGMIGVDSIASALADLSIDNQLPPRVVPFGDNGGGDHVCFDFRVEPPTVVYVQHELNWPEGVTLIAASFTEFLSVLRPSRDLDDE